MAFQGDAKNRRNILQGLQQTKSRLQRLHSDSPSRSSLHPASHQHGSHSPVFSAARSAGVMALTSRVSPSPSDFTVTVQQQKLLLQQQASSQSFSFFVPQHSLHDNLIMPVIPRFNSNGQLDTSW